MGGNVTATIKTSGQTTCAKKIKIREIGRKDFVSKFVEIFKEINKQFKKEFKKPIWANEKIIANGFAFNGSTSFIMSPDYSDDEIVKYKPSAGDLDITVPEELKDDLWTYLDSIEGKEIVHGVTYMGSNKPTKSSVGEQINTVFIVKFGNGETAHAQVDFEFLPFEDNKPTEWAKFSHGSSFTDTKVGVKAVHHKYLIRALVGGASVRDDIVIATGKSTPDKITLSKSKIHAIPRMLKFSVGRGIRVAYEPMLDSEGDIIIVDNKQVYKEIPTRNSSYETVIENIYKLSFQQLNGNESDVKLFNSFVGVVELMKKYLNKKQISQTHKRYIDLLWSSYGQELEVDDSELDFQVKNAGYQLLIKKLKLKDASQKMVDDYYGKSKLRENTSFRNFLGEDFKTFLHERSSSAPRFLMPKDDFIKMFPALTFAKDFDDNFFGDDRPLTKKRIWQAKTSLHNINILLNSFLDVTSDIDNHNFTFNGYKLRFIQSGKTSKTKRGANFTRQQELASLVVLKSTYLGESRSRLNETYTLNDIAQVFPDILTNKLWQSSYSAQSDAFKELLARNSQFSNKKLIFNREGGFMAEITKKVKALGVRNKDSWNPTDVWVHTKGAFSKLSSASTIQDLNKRLNDLFYTGDIMGVSLKLTGETAYAEKVNFSDDNEPTSYKFLNGHIAFNTKKKNNEFLNDEFSFNLLHPEGVINAQIRMYPKKPMARVQVSYKLKGAKSEMGKVPAIIRDKIYKDYTKATFPNGRTMPLTLGDYKKQRFSYNKKVNKIIKSFKTNIKSFDEFDANVISIYENLNKAYHLKELNTKFQCLEIAYNLAKLKSSDLTSCLTKWGIAAQKKGDEYAPFIKIY